MWPVCFVNYATGPHSKTFFPLGERTSVSVTRFCTIRSPWLPKREPIAQTAIQEQNLCRSELNLSSKARAPLTGPSAPIYSPSVSSRKLSCSKEEQYS